MLEGYEYTDREAAEDRFFADNRVILDAYGTRLVDLCKAGDDEGFLKKYAELEAFCRAGGEAGTDYWDHFFANDSRADAARSRIAAVKDPRPPREQVEAFIADRGPVPSGVVYSFFPDSFAARDIVAALKKEKKVASVRIGTPYLYFPGEGMEEKLDVLREAEAQRAAELAEIRRKHEAGEYDEGLSLDAGKIMSDMEEMVVEYGREHVDGFDEAQTRAMFRKGTDAPPKKSIFRRLFGK